MCFDEGRASVAHRRILSYLAFAVYLGHGVAPMTIGTGGEFYVYHMTVGVNRHSGPLYDPAWLWSFHTLTGPAAGGLGFLIVAGLRLSSVDEGFVHWHGVVAMLPVACIGVLLALYRVVVWRDRARFGRLQRAGQLPWPDGSGGESRLHCEGDPAELLRVIRRPPDAVAATVDADLRPVSPVFYLLLCANVAMLAV